MAPPAVNIDHPRLFSGMGESATELIASVSLLQDIDTDVSSETSDGTHDKESAQIAPIANFEFATCLQKEYERQLRICGKRRNARYVHFASARPSILEQHLLRYRIASNLHCCSFKQLRAAQSLRNSDLFRASTFATTVEARCLERSANIMRLRAGDLTPETDNAFKKANDYGSFTPLLLSRRHGPCYVPKERVTNSLRQGQRGKPPPPAQNTYLRYRYRRYCWFYIVYILRRK